MNRREALKLTTALLGGTIAGSQAFWTGCVSDTKKRGLFSDEDILLLDEIGETILPETDRSPGAKAAHIGEFMKTIVTDCYDSSEQTLFMEGIKAIRDGANRTFSRGFMELSDEQRFQFLAELDREAQAFNESESSGTHYFGLMKQLTMWGYFTSEPGCRKALRYNPVPGRYEGCIPYKEADKAWAL